MGNEILENNKLMAEFENRAFGMSVASDYKGDIPLGLVRGLKYHTSWDELMPVVEKIESFGYSCEIELFSCYVIDSETLSTIIECHYNSKIESVYKAVIKFIKSHT